MSFPLVADNDTGLLPERWHPAACSAPNLYSHITGVFAALVFGCFVFFGGGGGGWPWPVFVITKTTETKLREGWRMTLNLRFSVGQIHLLYCLLK